MISDAQIRALAEALVAAGRYSQAMWCDYALIPADRANQFDIPRGCDRKSARARCAELINRNTETQS